jgi:ATP-dependent DNA ligase
LDHGWRHGFVRPCERRWSTRPTAGPSWLHEVKHDGFRTLARKQGGRVQVWSRLGADFTYRFRRSSSGSRPQVDRALIDREAVVLRKDGHRFVIIPREAVRRGVAQLHCCRCPVGVKFLALA